ncbi:MAG TPA: nitronate monooxygenase [Streptosporangiaceae bacterium]|nr:nitronate monooxygenase [Streptosporangiaceae bacterium]
MVVTRYTELTGCRVPVQQAPMGSVSTAALAVAVAEAGGVGSIGVLGMSPAQVDKVLGGMAARASGVLAVNFLTSDIDPEAVAAAAARVRIIDFFWTDPDPALVEVAHRGGALACWQVGSLGEARAAAEAGCDVIAAQGTEAGGHVRGHSPLLPLLESVLGLGYDLPVLAAGGIGDARAFAAALAAGADGVRAGTRFVATAESGAHPLYKQAVADAAAGATEITGAFSVCPLCATSPRARVLTSCVGALREVAGATVGETTQGGQRVPVPRGHGMPPGAAATGHIDAMPMYAGESAAAITSVEPAAAILEAWSAAV